MKRGGLGMMRKVGIMIIAICILLAGSNAYAFLDSFLDGVSRGIANGIAEATNAVVRVVNYINGFRTSMFDAANGILVRFANGVPVERGQLTPDYNLVAQNSGDVIGDRDGDGDIDADDVQDWLEDDGVDNQTKLDTLMNPNNLRYVWTQIEYDDTTGAISREISEVNDRNGNVVDGMQDVVEYTNGRRTRVTAWVQDGDTGEWQQREVTFQYQDGRLASATGNTDLLAQVTGVPGLTTELFGATCTVAFDASGLPTSITGQDGASATLTNVTRDDMGRITSIQFSNGLRVERDYNSAGLLIHERVTNPDGTVASETVTAYAENGRRIYQDDRTQAGEETTEEDRNGDGRTDQVTTTWDGIRTFFIYNSPVFSTRINPVESVQLAEPPSDPDPAVTGTLFYDADTDTYYMEVEVWTNFDGVNRLEEPITVYLDLSKADDETKEAIANSVGQKMIIHGNSEGGVLEDGYTLEVLGLGVGPFEEHPLDL